MCSICNFINAVFCWNIDLTSPYIEVFKDNSDVVEAFDYLCNKITEFWNMMEFQKFKKICEAVVGNCHREFVGKVKAAKDIESMVVAFKDSGFCNWLNIHLLKKVSKLAEISEAQKIVQDYETCLHKKKVSEVQPYFKAMFFHPNKFSSVQAKINESFEDIIIANLLKYRKAFKSDLSIPNGLISVADCVIDCQIIKLSIPVSYSFHVFYMAKRMHHIFRRYHIQYLQINSYPIIYSTYLDIDEELLSALTRSSKACGMCFIYIAYAE